MNSKDIEILSIDADLVPYVNEYRCIIYYNVIGEKIDSVKCRVCTLCISVQRIIENKLPEVYILELLGKAFSKELEKDNIKIKSINGLELYTNRNNGYNILNHLLIGIENSYIRLTYEFMEKWL